MVIIKDESLEIILKRQVDESYEIVFGNEMFPKIASDLREKPLGSKYAIITDSNVGPLYADKLKKSLNDENLDASIFTFQAGEPNKTIYTVARLLEEMGEAKYGRDSAILALGGGVVGDTAGFIGAILNRGINTVQIPTTVLSQADSAVGGKTGVDLKCGKNLVGRIVQPQRVYIDVSTLKTLSSREYASGLAETIKHGIIYDKDFFDYLDDNTGTILERSVESSLYIAKNNCRIKGSVVEIDPNEQGLRRILNYGHTIGHAVEQLSVNRARVRPTVDTYLSHGAAVSIGMMVAGRIAYEVTGFTKEDLDRQELLLKSVGLPTNVPNWMSPNDIVEITSRDKKAKNGNARYVLPTKIGTMEEYNGTYATYVDNSIVRRAIRNSM